MELLFLVLSILDSQSPGAVCRSWLHSVAFLVGDLLSVDLAYMPHGTAVYSPRVEFALSKARSLDFIREHVTTELGDEIMPIREYVYELTSKGKEAIDHLSSVLGKNAHRILGALKSVLAMSAPADELAQVALFVAASRLRAAADENSFSSRTALSMSPGARRLIQGLGISVETVHQFTA
jgi:hypothetical protein